MNKLQFAVFFIMVVATLFSDGNLAPRIPPAEAEQLRPAPVSFVYQGTMKRGPESIVRMHCSDWNTVRIATKEEFLGLFEAPEEVSDVTVTDFTPKNKLMHGKIFRATQCVNGVPVYGSHVMLQTFAGGLVRSVDYRFSDGVHEVSGKPKPFPTDMIAKLTGGNAHVTVSKPSSFLYDPALVQKAEGAVELIWIVVVSNNGIATHRYFISQEDCRIVRQVSLTTNKR